MSDKISRREAIKKAVYMAPVILTLAASPSLAKGGSGYGGKSRSWSPKRDWSPKRKWFPKKNWW
jgi:hypothetical protein